VGDVPTDHTSHTRATAHGHCTRHCWLHTSLHYAHRMCTTTLSCARWRFIVTIIGSTPNRSRRIYSSAQRPRLLAVLLMLVISMGRPRQQDQARRDAAQVSRASMQTFKGGAYPALLITFIPFNGGWTPGLPSLTENGYLWLPSFAGWRPLAAILDR
jgi:hypothetical protein